jgi:hypothetical protein
LPPPLKSPQIMSFLHSRVIIYYYYYYIFLGIDNTYEQNHAIFGFSSLAYFIQYDDFQFYSFSWKQHNFILLCGWVILHSVYIPNFLYAFISYWDAITIIFVNNASTNMGV